MLFSRPGPDKLGLRKRSEGYATKGIDSSSVSILPEVKESEDAQGMLPVLIKDGVEFPFLFASIVSLINSKT